VQILFFIRRELIPAKPPNDFLFANHEMVLCQEKAQNKVSDDIEKGRGRGCGKRGEGP
jgi:hypothetical protein